VIVPTTVRKIVQFREGSRGFQVRIERGIPVCSREERKPVEGGFGGGEDGGWGAEVGAGVLEVGGEGVERALEIGGGGSGAAMMGRIGGESTDIDRNL